MSDYALHSHTFGQDRRRPGEVRTLVVMVITATMMLIEIAGGIAFGSMALLADGLHMGSHAVALGINFFAYVYARRNASNPEFCFGTGKVNSLGGFTGALLLAGFAAIMVYESVWRLVFPVEIAFGQAIAVAVVGLVVNGVSLLILKHAEHDHHHHGHEHDHHRHSHSDHNLISAYLHVLADTLTSVLAIAALLAARYLGWIWFDPVMGLIGAALVARWSWGLIASTSRVLLDFSAPADLRNAVRESLESDGSAVVDLHVWSIGPGLFAAVAALEADAAHDPAGYRERVLQIPQIVHASIEVNSSRMP